MYFLYRSLNTSPICISVYIHYYEHHFELVCFKDKYQVTAMFALDGGFSRKILFFLAHLSTLCTG